MVNGINDRPVNAVKEKKPLHKWSRWRPAQNQGGGLTTNQGLCVSRAAELRWLWSQEGYRGAAPSESHKVRGKAINTEAVDDLSMEGRIAESSVTFVTHNCPALPLNMIISLVRMLLSGLALLCQIMVLWGQKAIKTWRHDASFTFPQTRPLTGMWTTILCCCVSTLSLRVLQTSKHDAFVGYSHKVTSGI